MNNIYLCGFIGSGKDTIGKLIASRSGGRFLNLDVFIEKRVGCTISQLYKNYGEAAFRQVESSVLEEVCLMENAVVALGEGAFWCEQNIIAAKNSGIIIYLQVPFNVCYRRIHGDKGHPVAANRTKDELEEIYHKRHTLYKIAASCIFESHYPPKYCAKKLCELSHNFK